VFEVVEQDQELLAAKESGEVVARSDRLRELRGHELGVGETGKRHPEDTVSQRSDELRCNLERKAGLPGTSGSRDGEEARAVRELLDELADLALSPDERARGDRQIGGVERPKWWEITLTELVQALGSDQVLQPVLAEIADGGVALQEPASGLGEDDLPPADAAMRAARWTSIPT
jgi:hypothetical protein